MEKEKSTLEKEVRTQLIKEGSLKQVISRCVDKILLGKFDGHHFEVDKIRTSLHYETSIRATTMFGAKRKRKFSDQSRSQLTVKKSANVAASNSIMRSAM